MCCDVFKLFQYIDEILFETLKSQFTFKYRLNILRETLLSFTLVGLRQVQN